MQSNVFELQATLSRLISLCDYILSDNTTAVHCINNMGSCRSADSEKITKLIWDWAIKRGLCLSSAHIPRRLNREVNKESRETEN